MTRPAPATGSGPLARAGLRDTPHGQVRRTVDAGAVLPPGGEAPIGPGRSCSRPPRGAEGSRELVGTETVRIRPAACPRSRRTP